MKINKRVNKSKVKKGFTLIELLVAILIVGILVAICLPQYRKAVMKTRFSTMFALVNNIAQAQQRYYMLHDKYTDSFASLDIDLPEPKSKSGETSYTYNWGVCHLSCLVNNTSHCGGCRLVIGNSHIIYWYEGGWNNNNRYCITTTNGDKIGHKICKEITNDNQPKDDAYGDTRYHFK